jgi:hypothetical protein
MEMLDYQPDIDVVERNLKLQTQQLMDTTLQFGITLNDSVAEQAADNIRVLLLMTEGRTEIMQRLRDSLMQEASGLHPANYQSLLNVTILLERSIWLIRRLALTIKP